MKTVVLRTTRSRPDAAGVLALLLAASVFAAAASEYRAARGPRAVGIVTRRNVERTRGDLFMAGFRGVVLYRYESLGRMVEARHGLPWRASARRAWSDASSFAPGATVRVHLSRDAKSASLSLEVPWFLLFNAMVLLSLGVALLAGVGTSPSKSGASLSPARLARARGELGALIALGVAGWMLTSSAVQWRELERFPSVLGVVEGDGASGGAAGEPVRSAGQYAYTVAGRQFRSPLLTSEPPLASGRSRGLSRPLVSGDSVVVRYFDRDPTLSFLENPWPLRDTAVALTVLLLGAAAVAVGLWEERRFSAADRAGGPLIAREAAAARHGADD